MGIPKDRCFPRERHPSQRRQFALAALEARRKENWRPVDQLDRFRRTHATLLQLAGGPAKDAQAQLGHAQITTTLGIYTIPVPAHQRAGVVKLSRLMTNGDVSRSKPKTEVTEPSLLSELDGGRYRIRTYDFHRVKMALYR